MMFLQGEMSTYKGLLVVLEGIDGAGKSSQARILKTRLAAEGFDVVSFREPSRGRWGRLIKRKARLPGSLTPEEEVDLFLKDREENVRKNLEPALEAGKIVILDRYYFSTIAYQGARGLDPERIRRMNEKFAVKPDLVFILDIDARNGLRRISLRRRKDRLFEREKYLVKVRRIFQSFKGRKFIRVDARRPKGEIAEEIARHVWGLIGKRLPG